jgi:hypothetical protein
MSTTLEEIDNINDLEAVSEIDLEEIYTPEPLLEEPKDINKMIMNILYNKIKEPALVTFLMIIFTHPLLIKLIFNLPYIEVVEKTISVNVVLALSTGIAFFILRELV